MQDLPINMFDIIVLTVVGLSALLSFFRGLFKEVFSLSGWAVAAVVSLRFLEPAANYIKPHVGSAPIATGIAAVGLFFITLVLISILSGLLLKVLKPAAKIGLIDNLGGLAFGVARGALIVVLGYFIMSIVVGEKNYPKWITEAYSKPYVERGAQELKDFAPEYLDKLTGKKPGEKTLGDEAEKHLNTVIEHMERTKDATVDQVRDTEEKMQNESDKMPSFEDLQQRIRQENEGQ